MTDDMTDDVKNGMDSDRRRPSVLPWLLLLAGIFALLYLLAWLATRDGDTPATQPQTAEADTEVVETTTVPETTIAPTTAAPETTVPTTAAPETTVAPETTLPPATTEAAATIGDIARSNPQEFSTLLAAAEAAGFGPALDDAGPITVFAPTNAAFSSVDAATLGLIVDDTDLLTPTIAHHVLEGAYTSAELADLGEVTTLAGETLLIEADGTVTVGGVTISALDVDADNGVIHVIDGVLLPQSVSSALTASAVTTLLALEPIQFADSSAEITEASLATLSAALELLEADPEARLEIAGHTDDIGPAEGNQRLSQRRADAVRSWLLDNGIGADRLTAVGYGEDLPVADNGTAEGRAQNRRIEFVAR